ncbi:MAG: heme o synthase [Methanomassiliicoccales archaeon]
MDIIKLRLISAELLLAVASFFLAGGMHVRILTLLYLLLFGFMGLAGSAALNSYLDRDIDRVMGRTALRPIPSGRVSAGHVLYAGILLLCIAFVGGALLINIVTASIIVIGSLLYILLYTMYVKRTTPNAVILGGFAGAIPAFGGWTAYTYSNLFIPFLVFLVVFFWQPGHFWYLSTYYREDYGKAGVPVLPTRRERSHVSKLALAYNSLTVIVTLGLAFELHLDQLLIIPLFVLDAAMLLISLNGLFWREERKFLDAFHFTVIYMVIFLLLMIIAGMLHPASLHSNVL